MSSSDESEDENMKQFAAAIDTSLFNNEFYQIKEEKEKIKHEKIVESKSQRYLDNTENIFQSELNVSENMKEFIGNKMSKMINESTEYVTVKNCKIKNDEISGIRLLKGSKKHINLDHVDHLDYPKYKIAIKRRKLEESKKESWKVKIAATDVDKINHEVSLWERNNRHKVLEYKKSPKDNQWILNENEPTEYSRNRCKNAWNESKIKNSKFFNKGLCSISQELSKLKKK